MNVVVPASRRFAATDRRLSPADQSDTSLGAVGKAMLVLQCFSRCRMPVRLAEITRETGLAKSTVHRLLAILESHNAVRRVETGYVIGDTVRRLTGDSRGRQWAELRRVVMPHLADLYEATHLPTTLAVLHDFAAVSLVTIYPRSMAGPVLRTSERTPVHCTAAGKLLLAYAQPARLPAGDGWLVPFGPNTITRRPHFDAELARIRREGIAHSREEYLQGVIGLAVPILDRHLRPLAICVGGPIADVSVADTEPLLRRAAHAATLTLRRFRAARAAASAGAAHGAGPSGPARPAGRALPRSARPS